MSVATRRAAVNAAFAGIDGNGIFIVAIVALISAIRHGCQLTAGRRSLDRKHPPVAKWVVRDVRQAAGRAEGGMPRGGTCYASFSGAFK